MKNRVSLWISRAPANGISGSFMYIIQVTQQTQKEASVTTNLCFTMWLSGQRPNSQFFNFFVN